MSEYAGIGKAVGEYLTGNLAANRALFEVRSALVDPDHLYNLVKASQPAAASDYLRGFLRTVQKVIEREVQHG